MHPELQRLRKELVDLRALRSGAVDVKRSSLVSLWLDTKEAELCKRAGKTER